jgi:putative solute:sodium symporter small subunit
MTSANDKGQAYWKANLRIITICMIIWAVVSYGFGIVLRPVLDIIPVGGVGLGFWFAQQGSMYVFLALIFYYAVQMAKLDRQHGVEED